MYNIKISKKELTYIVKKMENTKKIGGILLTIAPVFKIRSIFGYNIYNLGNLEYYLMPINSGLNENYWYELEYPITDFSYDLYAGKLKVKRVLTDSRDQGFLFLNISIKL